MTDTPDTPDTPETPDAPEALFPPSFEEDGDRVKHINIEDEMSSSYIDYSMSVIIGRALPDARDGLKPVHRRVLFAMRELGNTHNKAYKKSARVVGDVIGKYHPHGDSAVYDTAGRMAQDFSLRYPLIDGQGNFGSIDGDPPAAMRYTEVRMDRLAEEMLLDLDKDTVEFGPNYDESLTQPLVLPSKLPNLLLNGSTGIAVGMATNMPPHNLSELVDAIIFAVDNPDCTVDDLMEFVKGPDFPTGGMICGHRQIEAMYKLGRGQMRVRGVAEIEENEKSRDRILISEVPYMVNKAHMIEVIARLVNEKVIEGIADLRDESSSQGIRVVIELKRGVIPMVVLNNIYKHTQLQTTFGANMLAIHEGQPRVMNLRQLIRCYTDHRFEVITRRTQFELKKAEARKHILEGLRIALDSLDEVVRTIRGSSGRDEARERLMERFGFSLLQTNAILDMRLYQLTGLEREKVEEEFRRICAQIEYLEGLLANPQQIFDIIKADLAELKDKYGDVRRTQIVPMEGEVNIEDLIADEPAVVTLSHTGYIKRVPLTTYREQRRGGKGVSAMSTKDDDFVEKLFVSNTHDIMLFFTSDGRVYWEKTYEIPESGRTSRGKAIVNLLNLREDETIAEMIRIREFGDDQYLVFATRKGIVKKTRLSLFRHIRKVGIIAINIDEDDSLIAIKLTDGQSDVMLATASGKSIRFPEKQLRTMGRGTRGVKGIALGSDDVVVSLTIVDDSATFLTCTENGYGKRSSFDEYRVQGRGGSGLIAIRTSERNGRVVGAAAVTEDESLMMVTIKGMMVRTPLNTVNVIGRATQGVRLINLNDDDRLVSATVIPAEDHDEDEPPEGEEGEGGQSAESPAGEGEQQAVVADGGAQGEAETAADQVEQQDEGPGETED